MHNDAIHMMEISVALIGRATLYEAPGGDTVQIMQTADFLNRIGVKAEVRLTDEKIDYEAYDLLHFFNITRPADILFHIKKSNKRFVVSTIHIDYSAYDKTHRRGLSGMLLKYLSPDSCEYLKTIFRWIKGKDKLISYSYLWKGQSESIQEVLAKSSLILPNSASEYSRLKKVYGALPGYRIINNGIDPGLFSSSGNDMRSPDLVICVARIEGIKNQLNLIKALNNTRYKLLLIGSPAPNQFAYYTKCKKLAAQNILFIDHLPQQELLYYYKRASIHILPSFFETTGLSSLEAAAMGCKIVITDKGDAGDYFGDMADYCDPHSPESIYDAVVRAGIRQYDESLQQKILDCYTWYEATKNTKRAYKEVIQLYETTHRNFGYAWNP
ncbi:glycosyltransferase family 4 protein [Danxiaibacter flavus]|uniref:Glycosyltransferase family 4 protein n=1 Tax=Danxiaibacter flavus TaxID=3049108 RepID=A0ABV3Z937_9BACT|nr:glycosyltransferase family 4 protein [Chitinophagaceae bacterium DXS]